MYQSYKQNLNKIDNGITINKGSNYLRFCLKGIIIKYLFRFSFQFMLPSWVF